MKNQLDNFCHTKLSRKLNLRVSNSKVDNKLGSKNKIIIGTLSVSANGYFYRTMEKINHP